MLDNQIEITHHFLDSAKLAMSLATAAKNNFLESGLCLGYAVFRQQYTISLVNCCLTASLLGSSSNLVILEL
jgi:hypothetical protein